ncbi:MAG: hypothetical protein MJE68_04945 [Proteobacteria bacterium]|nr:hypothetical protein [Pseudomonadota bacterium]
MKFNASKERTLHILSHYIEGDLQLDDIRKEIARFAEDNCDWIEAVGKPSLDAFGCKTVNDYIDALLEGTVVLDQLAVLLFARVYKIHCVIILNGRFWSTRSDFNHNECQIKLAFTGDYKEFCAVQKENEQDKDDAKPADEDEDNLEGTGIMSREDSGDPD